MEILFPKVTFYMNIYKIILNNLQFLQYAFRVEADPLLIIKVFMLKKES